MKINTLLIGGAAMIIIGGCTVQQPTPQLKELNVTEVNHIYESDEKIKKAIVILAKKVEILELSGVSVDNNSTELNTLKHEIDGVKMKEARLSTQLENKIKILEDRINKLSKKPSAVTSVKSTSSCKIVIYAMRSSGFYKAKSNVNVRACPVHDSLKIGVIKKGTSVEFEGCDSFGWCKLKNRDGYVAGRLFTKIATSTNMNGISALKQENADYVDSVLRDYIK